MNLKNTTNTTKHKKKQLGGENNTLQPFFFSLSENYYLQIPKTQI